VRRQDVGGGHDVGSRGAGDGRGGVGGVGVDDEQFVDQGDAAHPVLAQVGHQPPDGRLLVPGRQDDAHAMPAAALGAQEGVEVDPGQGGGGRRPVLEPGAGVGSHRLTVDDVGSAGQDGGRSSRVRHRTRVLRIPCASRAGGLRFGVQSLWRGRTAAHDRGETS
jgi:hypothetical protein